MQSLHEVVIAIVAFIVLIGVLVVVHEFGHFLVAKLCGVRVEQFSIGFPPRLFGVKIGETDYCISALPFGGYVKMTGENLPGENMSLEGANKEQTEAQEAGQAPAPGAQVAHPDVAPANDTTVVSYAFTKHVVHSDVAPAINAGRLGDDPGALTSHPRWQRILIGLAGPVANFVLAFALMAVYYACFNEVPKYAVNTTTVEWIVPGSQAARAGLEPGDVIERFDTVDNPDWMQVAARASLNLGQTVRLMVNRGGKQIPLAMYFPGLPKGEDFDFSDVGILPQLDSGPIGVYAVEPGTPAAKAGLLAGDKIVSVDGHVFHYVGSLLAYMEAEQGRPMALGVERNGAALTLEATPTKLDASGYKLGFEASATPLRNEPMPVGKAMAQAKDFCVSNSTLIVDVLGRLFEHKVAVSQLSGPVGIARIAGEAAETKGWMSKFYTTSAISLNLGILNLLPFPILDGGMILFLLIEGALRHDISLAVKERIYQAAFVVLVVFFAFIIFNDVSKLPVFMHVKP